MSEGFRPEKMFTPGDGAERRKAESFQSEKNPFFQEKREAETVRETREFRDKEGKLIAIAEVEYETRDGKPGYGRRLHSLTLRSGESSNTQSVDLLAFTNATSFKVDVIVADTRLQGYYYSRNTDSDHPRHYVVIPPLNHALDISTMLHELGHANQYQEERFAQLGKFRHFFYNQSPPSPDQLTDVLAILPDVDAGLSKKEREELPKILEEIESLEKAMSETYDEGVVLAGLDTAYTPPPGWRPPAMIRERLDVLQAAYAEAKKKLAPYAYIMAAPTRVLEYDATRRALHWLHDLQKQGIDLLGTIKVEAAETINGRRGVCADSVRVNLVEITAKENLADALTNYGATKKQLRESHGGIIPSPRLKQKRSKE